MQGKLLKVDKLVLVLRELVFAKVFLVGNVFAGICFCDLFKNPRKSRNFFFLTRYINTTHFFENVKL